MDPAPLIYASTCPGGYLTSGCYTELKSELIDRLYQAMPVDGVLLPLHGAAVAEDVPDLEGDLIKAVREIVGQHVPIVVTLDLHAHVTADMVHFADALIAWETYPHRDAFTTGERGARLLLEILGGRCRPTMAMGKVPVITSPLYGSTEGDDPFAHIMRLAKSYESHKDVLSTSVFLVFPYLDQAKMGSGAVVITDDNMDKAVSLAQRIAQEYWARRFDFEPELYTPQEAIARGLEVDGGPVLLVEPADCCGGGASGDSVATLKALIEANVPELSLVSVVDPQAAQLGDGRFRYAGGIWDGVEGDMGPSAVLTIGAIQVLVATQSTYEWADEQFRCMQMNPSKAKFVVVKNPMNYRMAYGDIAKATFILDTPGPTPTTVRHVPFEHLKRPYFPVDNDIPGFTPTILR
jgi:microcystin degradation protein MlrC